MKVKDVKLQLEFLHVELKKNKCEDEFYVESFAPRAYALYKRLKDGCVRTEYTGTLNEVRAFILGARWSLQNRRNSMI